MRACEFCSHTLGFIIIAALKLTDLRASSPSHPHPQRRDRDVGFSLVISDSSSSGFADLILIPSKTKRGGLGIYSGAESECAKSMF